VFCGLTVALLSRILGRSIVLLTKITSVPVAALSSVTETDILSSTHRYLKINTPLLINIF